MPVEELERFLIHKSPSLDCPSAFKGNADLLEIQSIIFSFQDCIARMALVNCFVEFRFNGNILLYICLQAHTDNFILGL